MRIAEFYQYLRRRESIRLQRLSGLPWPWTTDPILQKYRFTNVKRLHDRTSQELLKIYERGILFCGDDDDADEQFLLNCAIARYFGRSELVAALGWQSRFDPDHIRSTVEVRMASGEPVFTAAYVISNMGERRPKVEVVLDFLGNLWNERMAVLSAIYDSDYSWKAGIRRMQEIRGYGGSGFMAKEILLDTMMPEQGNPIWDEPATDRYTWSPAGPGARRGVCRILDLPPTNIAESRCLPVMLELLGRKNDFWPDGPDLDLHDIQFGLCEFDKYERARTRTGEPKRRYSRPR